MKLTNQVPPMSADDGEPIGYGRPPHERRFRKGQSGNPRGRPKGSKNFATTLSAELNQRVSVNENGKRKTISLRQAIAKQLVNRAASGDLKAISPLFNETRALETADNSGSSIVQAEDKAVMKGIIARILASNRPDDSPCSGPTQDKTETNNAPASDRVSEAS